MAAKADCQKTHTGSSVVRAGYRFLLGFGLIYTAFLLSLLIPAVQNQVFYLNSVKIPYFADSTDPTSLGFSSGRVRSFFLQDRIHAWHIKPLMEMSSIGPSEGQEAQDNGALILKNTSRLIIYFHGTAGTLAVSHRLTTYRLLSAARPETHVLAFDYRGFGLSPGHPDETGLINDGMAAVDWATNQGFTDKQITLFGHSLGSAVALGVAHEVANRGTDSLHLKQVVSVAGFTSVEEVLKDYRLGGIIPILGPLRTYPWLQKWFIAHLMHKWNSSSRAYELASSTTTDLMDTEILMSHSAELYRVAVAGSEQRERTVTINSSSREELNTVRKTVSAPMIRCLTLPWGDHNLGQWNDDLLRVA